jgi:hypothetical protein
MKRSEAVQKLKTLCILEDAALTDWGASLLLRFIEHELGMLPPGREDDKITFSNMDGTITGSSYELYRWEEE